MISSLAFFAASGMLDCPVKMAVSMFGIVPAFSTFAQFGAVGTNQVFLAASPRLVRLGLAVAAR